MDKTLPARFIHYDHELGQRVPYEVGDLGVVVDDVVLGMEVDAGVMGYKEFQAELSRNRGFDTETGLNYAVLHGGAPERTSTDRAVILHAALGISLDEMLPLAELIRRIADARGLTDDLGNPLAVVVTGTPDHEFARRLSRADKKDMASGDIGVIGRKNLELVNRLLPRKLCRQPLEAIFVGYSLGTANAVASAEYAPDFNIHVESLMMGATPNVMDDRNRRELLGSFVVEGARGSYRPGTPRVFTEPSGGQLKFWKDIVHSASFYYGQVLAGVAKKSATQSVLQGWQNNGETTQINIGGGTHDRIGVDVATNAMADALIADLGANVQHFSILRARHPWSRDIPTLGRMVGLALDRANGVDITRQP